MFPGIRFFLNASVRRDDDETGEVDGGRGFMTFYIPKGLETMTLVIRHGRRKRGPRHCFCFFFLCWTARAEHGECDDGVLGSMRESVKGENRFTDGWMDAGVCCRYGPVRWVGGSFWIGILIAASCLFLLFLSWMDHEVGVTETMAWLHGDYSVVRRSYLDVRTGE